MHYYILVTQSCQPLAGGPRQLGHDLDRENLAAADNLAEDGGLVARAGSHFENLVFGAESEQIGHHRDDGGLADGLAVAYGQRVVRVGVTPQFLRHEFMAWDLGHGQGHGFTEMITPQDLPVAGHVGVNGAHHGLVRTGPVLAPGTNGIISH